MKINKKISTISGIAIIIAVVVILFGGVFVWKYFIVLKQPRFFTQNNLPQNNGDFHIIFDKDYVLNKTPETSKIGTVEFRIFPPTGNIGEARFEVYNNGKKVFGSVVDYSLGELLAFEYKKNKYVVVEEFSGGAHCCSTDYFFRIDSANNVKLIKTFDMGNGGISKDSFILKNNKLYLTLMDDSFAYFYVSYAGSPFFEHFYVLDGDNFILADLNFKTDYVKAAQECASNLDEELSQKNLSNDTDYQSWFSDLTCRVVNYKFAGQDDKAWEGFENYFKKAQSISPDYIKSLFIFDSSPFTAKKVKQEIIDQLARDRFLKL